MLNFLKFIFTGRRPRAAVDSFRVEFYLTGGQVVTTTGVKEFKASKTPEGGFASYSIEWHDVDFKPAMLSLSLDHISAVMVTKES